MPGRLAGKVAIVTGGASGLGLASLRRFAEEGARVVCADLGEDRVAAAVAEVEAAGGEALGLVADVTDAASQERMAAETLERLGAIDVLYANAGIARGEGRAHEVSLADWELVLAVNLNGVFRSVRAVLPAMMRQRRGSILLQGSVAGMAGVPAIAAYAAAKGGVIALARQLAVDYAPYGIRVNAICPATVMTPLVAEAYAARRAATGEAWDFAERARDYPLGRLGEPGDVAELAVYLASDEAAWTTGTVIPVDGGVTAAMVPRHAPAR